jgi:hypothetical protein
MNGIGYRILRGGDIGNLLNIPTIITEANPSNRQAATNNAEWNNHPLTHAEVTCENLYGRIIATETNNP